MEIQQPTYNPQQNPQLSDVQRRRLRAPQRRRATAWQRMSKAFIGNSPNFQRSLALPRWLYTRGIAFYFLALAVVTGWFYAYSLPWYYMLAGTVSILVFFGYGQRLSCSLSVEKIRGKRFEQRIFGIAFVLRLVWMLLIYYIFMENYGNPFGFENADAVFYDDMGLDVAEWIRDGVFADEWGKWYEKRRGDLSDMGYATYVGFIYYLTDNSIIAVRLIKCVYSAIMVVILYRLTSRHFGSNVGRVAAIFCALWPNFWYYCGTHLKETEMVFLAVLFVEQGDQMLQSRQFTAWKITPLLLIIGAMFALRTPLALVAVLVLLFTIVMSSSRVVNWGKRIAIGTITVALIGVTMGNRIAENARQLIETSQGGTYQSNNMEWRGRRENGNAFAKYAGVAVFAPMIFTIPFSSMVRPFDGQEVQQLLNGGNFIKNIMSFFTILSMFVLLFTGDWRKHLLPLSFMLGYIMVLVLSVFAQSERFHQPVMPFEWMFAAYGLSIVVSNKRYQRWFSIWCVIMLVAVVAWGWFKLAGRGLA